MSSTNTPDQNLIAIKQVDKKLSLIFGLLRAVRQSNFNARVTVFLLAAYHENVISDNIFAQIGNVSNIFFNAFKNSKSTNANEYLTLLEKLKPAFLNLGESKIIEVLQVLFSIDKEILDSYFSYFFEKTLFASGAVQYPPSVVRLMCSLVSVSNIKKVYNPFGNLATFGVQLDGDFDFFGQDPDELDHALGKLRIRLISSHSDRKQYTNEDSVLNWPNPAKRFDLVISIPPFGVKVNDKYRDIHDFHSIQQFLIKNGVNSLNENGKLIALIPVGSLTGQLQRQHIIHSLVRLDWLESLVFLPPGLLEYTMAPFVIVTINKNKRHLGRVRLIDTKDFVMPGTYRYKEIDFEAIEKIFNGSNEIPMVTRLVSNEEVKSNNYDLSLKHYFKKQYDGVRLEEIVNFIRGSEIDPARISKVVLPKDLKGDPYDYYLDLDTIQNEQIARSELRLVAQSCILLATFGRTSLRPTLFDYKKDAILIPRNQISAFEVNENLVIKEYLVHELQTDYIIEQLEAINSGRVTYGFSLNEILELRIKLPSLEEQIAKVDGFKQSLLQRLKIDAVLKRENEKLVRQLQSTKHTYRQYLSNLRSGVSSTRKFIKSIEGTPIYLNLLISPNGKITLEEQLLSLDNTIDQLNILVGVESQAKTELASPFKLPDLVREAMDCFRNVEVFQFLDLDIDFLSFMFDEEAYDPIIEINKADFLKVFSNVVSNAVKHGFKNSEKSNYILTSLSFDPTLGMCVLKIANNGLPMPDGFDLKRLTTLYEKTADSDGIGIGGADIFDIVQKYKGVFELETDYNNEYPVTYIMKFPLLKIMKNEN